MQDQCGTQLGRRRVEDSLLEELFTLSHFLILKGTGIQQHRHEGVYDRELLNHVAAWGGKTNRIDLAIDVLHPEVTPRALFDLYDNNRIVTRVDHRKFERKKANRGTFSLLSQHKMLRIYDKTGERARKADAKPLPAGVTRFEMEYRGPPAVKVFRELQRIPEDTWSEEFPRLAIGWMLQFARPLDQDKPDRNPLRAPMWKPLEEALEGLGPVQLNASAMVTPEDSLRGKAAHVHRNLGGLRMMAEIMGEGAVLQAIRHGKMNDDQADIVAYFMKHPGAAQAVLSDAGFALGKETHDGDE